ncbi:MAG: membrane-bound PQQ-dependent dehydrogenase, glucose/quinate/shikimate family [Alphaproteobacteria bacterium]|nr:membrane-bound PQQ-dependent dehydrogenase, glucose/quinate/shikimate family [Alphaproteobacteria bacterium]
MATYRRGPALPITAAVLLLFALALLGGGAWLVALGGSWFYAVMGAALLATAALLFAGSAAALGVYAGFLAATLAWSLWEAGLDWWPLAARVGLFFVVGLFLVMPWVAGRLGRVRDGRPRGGWWGAVPLGLALLACLAVAVASWKTDPHRIDGRVVLGSSAPEGVSDMPAGDWWAYGRTGLGRRYSPLGQITPENVARLKVAWRYHTGDVPGQPGDPVETTFEVTPLKIGNRLFLCTPHQQVVALDATTGREVWRYEPRLEGDLALQHLTCRGLSYHPATTRAAPADAAATDEAAAGTSPGAPLPPLAVEEAPSPRPDLPVAARDAPTAPSCTAKLFLPTADGRLIALDPENGRVCADFGDGTGQIDLWRGMPNVDPGAYYSTSPVVVTAREVIVGGSVLDNVSTHETSGVIRAYDVDTGKLLWAWDSGDPSRTVPLAPGQTYTANSPNTWSIASVDEGLGMIYVPMGNQPPDQWGGNRSAATERFSSSVVALDLATGQVRWVFQTVHHDLWDYDVPSQPGLVDLRVGDATVPALVQPTKQGEIFVLDRRTGTPLLPVREVPAPQGAAKGDHAAASQPRSALSYDPPPLRGRDMWGATVFDQLACRIAFHRLRYDGRFTPPSQQGSLIYPGNFGVFNWGSVAVDPDRQIVFSAPAYLAFVSTLVPRDDDRTLYVHDHGAPPGALPALNENFGAPYAVRLKPFTSPIGLPCQEPPWGYVSVADLRTGRIVWMHKNGTVRDRSPLPLPFRMGVPSLGGPIVTRGGVAFLSGTIDYYVRAYDVATGKQLWRSRLPAGGQATPMTYRGADGRQYLLVVAGGHGSLGTKTGDSVIAYALPPGG